MANRRRWLWDQVSFTASTKSFFDLQAMLGDVHGKIDKGMLVVDMTIDESTGSADLEAREFPRLISEFTAGWARCQDFYEACDGPSIANAWRLITGRNLSRPDAVATGASAGNRRVFVLPLIIGGRESLNETTVALARAGKASIQWSAANPFDPTGYSIASATVYLGLRRKATQAPKAGPVASVSIQTDNVGGVEWDVEFGGVPYALALSPLDEDTSIYTTISPGGGGCEVPSATPVEFLQAAWETDLVDGAPAGVGYLNDPTQSLQNPPFLPLMWPSSREQGITQFNDVVGRMKWRAPSNTANSHRSIAVTITPINNRIRKAVGGPSGGVGIPDSKPKDSNALASIARVAEYLPVANPVEQQGGAAPSVLAQAVEAAELLE